MSIGKTGSTSRQAELTENMMPAPGVAPSASSETEPSASSGTAPAFFAGDAHYSLSRV
jgi:hypothetical protein